MNDQKIILLVETLPILVTSSFNVASASAFDFADSEISIDTNPDTFAHGTINYIGREYPVSGEKYDLKSAVDSQEVYL